MKQRGKQLLSVLLTLVMLLGMIPGGVTIEARADRDVAQIGDNGYQTLQAALDAAENNDTVQLIADVKENVVFGAKYDKEYEWWEDKNISATLDLNGHSVTGTGNGSVISVRGSTLTITDSAPATGAHKYAITDGLAVLSEEGGRSFTGGYITGGTGTPDNTYGEDGVTNGGGIYVAGGAALRLNGGTIIGNRATFGGGIHVDYGACGFTIGKNAAIIGNQAAMNEDYGGDGGGVYVRSEGTYQIEGTDEYANYDFAIDGTISYNKAVEGGGVYTAQVSNTTISATIEHNTAENGGGVYADGYEPVLQNSTIRYNSAITDGGGVYAAQGTLVIRDETKITDNTAGGKGGGVFLYWVGEDLYESTSVALNGEGLAIKENTGGNLYLSREKDVEPQRDMADWDLYNKQNKENYKIVVALDINGSEENIIGITLGTPDGTGQFTGLINQYDIEEQEFTNDTAESLLNAGYFFSDDPGLAVALTAEKNELQLIAPPHAHKLNGTAGEEGTVNFTKFSTLKPTDGVYTIAPEAGHTVSYYLDADVEGRIVIPDNSGTVNLCLNGHKIDAAGTGNTAITVRNASTLNLCDCHAHSEAEGDTHYYQINDTTHLAEIIEKTEYDKLNANAAKGSFVGGYITGGSVGSGNGNGSGVFVLGGATFRMSGGTIIGNQSDTGAGIAMREGTTLTMTGGNVIGNCAEHEGGGIKVDNNNHATISGVTVKHNYAAGSGGGILARGINSITNSYILNNECAGTDSNYGGGGIYNDGTLTLTNCTISGNKAGGYGGGIKNYGTLTISGGTITKNESAHDGGGICHEGEGKAVTITNCTISQNSASEAGGGIYHCYNSMTINGGSITGNTAGTSGAGVFVVGNRTLKLNGAPTITGNTVSGKANNVYLDFFEDNNYAYITSDVSSAGDYAGLKPGASVGVTLHENYANNDRRFTKDIGKADAQSYMNANYFSDDAAQYSVMLFSDADGDLKLDTAYPKPTASTLTYDGSSQALVTEPEDATDYTFQYSTTEEGDYGTTVPTGKDAGTYYVWYKVDKGDEHYGPTKLTVTIAKKSVTVSGITADNKTYDGTTDATFNTSGAILTGKAGSDDLTVTVTGTFDTANAGEGKTVTISNLALSGSAKDNYVLAKESQQTETTAKITPKSVTITAKPQSVELNGSTTTDGLTLNAAITDSAKIEKAVTAAGLLASHSLSSVTLEAVTSAVTTTGTVTPKNAAVKSGSTVLTDNYSFTYASGTLTVTPTQPAVTWPTPGEITYGDPLSESKLTGGSATDKNDEGKTVNGTFTWKTPTTKPTVSDSGTTTYTLVFTPTGEDASSYGRVENEVTVTVNKATLTVKADNKTKVYGDALPALTYSVSGLKGSDKAADVLTGALGCAATADFAVSSEEGYAINQGTLKLSAKGSENYTLSFESGKLSVTQKSIKTAVITLAANDIQRTDSAVSPTITSVTLDGEELSDLDYEVSGNSGTENGSYTLTITGKGNYKDAATKVWRIVGTAVPTLEGSLSTTDISYGKTLKDSTISGTMKSGGKPVEGKFTWKQPATAPGVSDSGTTRYAVLFTPNDATNYSSVTLYATLTVNRAPLTVTADAKTRVYGGSNPALTYTVNGLQNGDKAADVLTGALSCDANGTTSVGDADITVGTLALSTAGAINYTFNTSNYTGAKLTITPKSIRNAAISLAASQIGYTGSTVNAGIPTVTLDGKTLSDSDYDVSGNSGTAEGDYTLTVTGKGNYKDTATAGWKIVAHPLTVESPSATAITYGQTLADSTISGTVKSGDTPVAGTFAWARPAIKPSVLDSDSTMYAVTFTPTDSTYKPVTLYLSLIVNKAMPTGTPSASAINFGDTLSASRLTGEMTKPNSQVKVPGVFTWSENANPTTTIPPVGNSTHYNVTFTPNDTYNYETVTNLSAAPTVNKALWSDLTLSMDSYVYGTTPSNYSFKDGGSNVTPATIQYSTSKNGGWQGWTKQTLNVGTYFLRATKAGDNEHEETAVITSFRVTPARYDNPQNPAVTDYTVTVNSADITNISAGQTLQYAVVKTDSVGDFFIPANQSAVNSENLPTLPYVDAPALSNGTFALRGLQNSTDYTIYFRYKASADGNYLESFSSSCAWTTPASYTVVYNANYGTGTVPAQTNSSGSGSLTVASGSALKRTGYTFDKWNTKADGTGTTYAAADSIGTGATLYAQWTPIDYTLKLYDSDGNTQIGSDIALTYEQVTVLPTPTRDGYTFAGWAESSSTVSAYSGGQTVKNLAATNTTINLYAVWTENTYALGGNVLSYAGSNSVTLKLMRGNAEIAKTTTNNPLAGEAVPYAGTFSFGPVPAGEYNIVAEQTYQSNISGHSETVTITQHVTITDADEDDIVIEIGDSGVSSIVEVKDDAPPVVVESLEKVAESVAEADKKVELTMTVEKQEEQELPEDATDLQKETQDAIKDIKGKESSDTTFDFLDITLEKATQTWAGSGWSVPENERMRSTDEWVGVTIPYDFTGKSTSNFVLYRSHNGQSEKMEKLSERNGSKSNAGKAYFWLDTPNNLILIYTKGFSTYAIGYSDDNGGTPMYTGSSAAAATYPVTVSAPTNGTAKADKSSAAANAKVTVTAAPNDGCKVSTVIVTDQGGKVIPVSRNANGTYSFTMPASAVTVSVTFAKSIASPKDTGVADWLITDDHIIYLRGYDDGTISPNNNITRAEVSMIFYRLLLKPQAEIVKTFPDVKGTEWYATAVNTLANLGIVNGYDDGLFHANNPITRAEFAAIATRFAKATGGTVSFTDVASGHWAYGNIATAADYGWVTGYEGMFRPADKITRAETATIVNHMLGRAADQEYVLANSGKIKYFPDLQDATKWYYFDMVEASNEHDFTRENDVEKWTTK